VAAKHSTTKRFSRPSRRTAVVWGVFLGAMTVVTGLLVLRDRASLSGPAAGFLLTSVDVVGDKPASAADPIFQLKSPLDRQRWTGIVIHHSGEPAGDADSITRKHLSFGYKGLGYHFLIGNGNGMGDGQIHVGYRWNEQLPGAHVMGQAGAAQNQHSIGICLIGNGDRHEFTDAQMTQLVALVQRLQRELHIPARNVLLHRDLARQTTSPGRLFDEAEFRQQLLGK
jgi:N-acetylmuramoyl-L-alanine amidase